MRSSGVILRRPVGSDGPFREHADLPTHLSDDGLKHTPRKIRTKPKKQPSRANNEKAAREAALVFEREEERREAGRRRKRPQGRRSASNVSRRLRRRRRRSMKPKGGMTERAAAIEAERDALERRSQTEDARWEKQKEKLEAALRRARD
jgi:colicin import membrane protein